MSDFIPEVKEVLRRLEVPFKCGRTTCGDGSCFFHAVMDQLSLPGSRLKVSRRASTISDYLELRRVVICFMATNRELQEIDKFILEKLAIEETQTWESYLEQMSNPGTYVDFFTIWCTALFLGRDIMLATNSTHASKQQPWTVVPGGYEDSCFESQQPPLTLAYLDDRHFQSLYALEESETRCRGCFWSGQSIRRHLGQPSVKARGCPLFYDLEDPKDRHRKQKTAAQRRYDQEHREEKRQYDEKHRPEKREAQRRYDEKHRPEKRESQKRYDKKHRPEKRRQRRAKKVQELQNDSAEKRFYRFKENIKDTWSYPCICCHRINSSGGVRKLPGKDKDWRGQWKRLEQELEEKRPGLCKEAIKKPDENMTMGGNFHLCSTCNNDLRQKKKFPRYSYNNGLEADKRPPELDLTDLEETLIAKNILFLKVCTIRKSGWPAIKPGKTVIVPMLDEDLLKTMNSITALPRAPSDAGLIPVSLKRKLEYKNKVFEAYVRPDMLLAAVQKLKDLGHPGYQDVELASFNLGAEDASEDERSDSSSSTSDEEADNDYIRRYQLDKGEATFMTEEYPESNIVVNETGKTLHKKQRDESVNTFEIAPGEGKVPTSLMRDETYDVDAFPTLHPTGRFGLHYPRKYKISPQEYFKQRLQNFDQRWAKNKAYVFSALYYIERHHLESQINVSCQRGKLVNGTLVNAEECCSVFDNACGTPRYWQKKRYEVVAKLEQLGPFQLFFTLSCADKRWDEGFISILRQRGATIEYKPKPRKSSSEYGYEANEVWITQEGKSLTLKEFMAKERLHDVVSKNVLAITMTFDKRLHAFINKIAAAKGSPMRPMHYHYRVEFQQRGAAHAHGVLWLDIDDLDKSFGGLKTIMKKLQASVPLSVSERQTTADFVDEFITCSLENEDLVETVKEVQTHSHKETCRKYGTTCRFGFPKYPSERTIIAQPLNRADFASEKDFKEETKRYKDILKKVKDVILQLTTEDLDKITLEEILERADVDKREYHDALGVSLSGTSVILQRTPAELYINNYNEEWLKAWDGNMDLQMTLDFFAVITYITDYYTKAESKMTKILKEAAKSCAGMERKDQLRYMVQAFMDNREMGECEAYYRMFPQLHLSDSDLTCKFVSTGFSQNRSKFFVQISQAGKDRLVEEEEDNPEEDDQAPRSQKISIPGREGLFAASKSDHEKYAHRPSVLEDLCFAQFCITYDMAYASQKKKEDHDDESKDWTPGNIISWNPDNEVPLPYQIKLKDGKGFMRLRQTPKVLRIHKFREDKNPHEYFFSELLLYRPWRSEKELHPDDMDSCINLFNEVDEEEQIQDDSPIFSKIQKVKAKIFPHKNNIEEARALLELLPDERPQHIGDVLDPEFEQSHEDHGVDPDEEYAARDPIDLSDAPKNSASKSEKSIYRRVDVSNRDEMLNDARLMDEDQRVAFDIIIKYVKGVRKSERSAMPKPKAPLLKVQGKGGCGKSKLINVLTKWVEYWSAIGTNKDPSQPHVVRAAFTGRAGVEIEGTTLQSAFKLPWGNVHYSLSDTKRATMKAELDNLTLVIIDEMSMVKADILYQLNMRLREIKGSRSLFGGVAVLLCGDLLQLKPIKAAWIFEEPKDPGSQLVHAIQPLWEQFSPIELTKNHRQGEDKMYAELLGRVREQKHTKEDMELLKSRLATEFPENALHTYGTNDAVNKENLRRMARLTGQEEVMVARHIHPFRKNWKPQIKGGLVEDTAFHQELRLKIGARIMVVFNVDIPDELVNGSTGVIVDFVKEKDKVILILVDLDRESAGRDLRKKHEHQLMKWNRPYSTPIGRITFSYGMGKAEKGHSSKVQVIQFPVAMAFAMTCHKFQGMTVKKPTPLVVDMESIWSGATGMAYVMLSRIQSISQLILKSFDETKIKANKKALAESDKMKRMAINNPVNRGEWMSPNCLLRKIVSLNIKSLPLHLEDLKSDPTIKMADIICLQETFCKRSDRVPMLQNYTAHLAGEGRGRGVAMYIKDSIMRHVQEVRRMDYDFFQGLKVTFRDLQLINIYRSPNPAHMKCFRQFVQILTEHLDDGIDTIICGDFNFNFLTERSNNPLCMALGKRGFQQIVKEPTTIAGTCIDHVYIRLRNLKSRYELYSPYYADHDGILLMLKKRITM